MSTTFGSWIRAARGSLGMSQERLALEAGIDRGHLSKMETGKVAMPGPDTRAKLHHVFGTSDDDLVAAGILEVQTFRRGDRVYRMYRVPELPPGAQEGARHSIYDAGPLMHLAQSLSATINAFAASVAGTSEGDAWIKDLRESLERLERDGG